MRIRHLLLSALFLVSAFGLKAQVLSEGFENGVPPTGWVQFGNGVGTAQFWQSSTTAFAGAASAFVRYENVTGGPAEDWLVTPSLTLGPGDSVLTFYQRQAFGTDYGSVYTVRVSTDTSQTSTAGFTTIDTQVETDFGTGWTPYTVSLAAYTGQTVYIAFVMTNDDGDNWYLDEMTVGGVPCGIFDLAVNNITSSTADLSWNSISAMNEVEIVTGGATPSGSGSVVTANTFNATSLLPGTDYDAYVRGLCNGDDKLVISGAFDGPLPGGQPKGAELYVIDDIADLSAYGISSANNGGGTTAPNPEFVFPAISVNAGDYIYITSDSAAFVAFFGFSADFESNAMLINGDDAVELFKDSVVIDVFGDVNVDGTGQTWEYLDGWAYRMSGAYANGGTFVDSLWNYSGVNQLEGGMVNDSCTSPFPLGTFTTEGPSAWSMISFTTLCAPVTIGDSSGAPIMIPTTPAMYTDSGSTVCYTDKIANASNDVWYMLVTDPCATSIDASLCNGTTYDSYLRIYDTSLNQLAFNDDACSVQSQILGHSVSGGDTLFIVVEGFSGNNGFYNLQVTQNLATPNAAITYPAATYCPADADPTATIVADTGGVFTSTVGLVLDSLTGMIDISASMAGSYNVVYTVGSGNCFGMDTVALTINAQDTAAFMYAADSVCTGSANPVPSVTGSTGTFSGSTGLMIDANTGEIDLSTTAAGSYTVSFSTAGVCPDSASSSIVVVMTPDASFAFDSTTYCQVTGTATPAITMTGGTFSGSAGLVIDPSTGVIDLANSTVDPAHTVTYTFGGICPASTSVTVGVDDCLVGIEDGFANQFSIFPVPNQGRFFLQNTGEAGFTQIEVVDLTGRVMLAEEFNFSAGDKREIVLDNAAAGTYFLRARTENRFETLRFTVVY